MDLLIAIFVALFGLVFGSFFNVLIWRLPRDESLIHPGSHCPKCNRPVRAVENIPVASYLFLGGRCAGCRERISPLYPLIELATAGLALVLYYALWQNAPSYHWTHVVPAVFQSALLLTLLPVTIIDIRHYIIPDQITLPFLALGLAVSVLPGDTTPLQSAAGILTGGGTLFLIGWLGKIVFRKGEAMGGGDIKLLAAAGALWGPKIALLTIMFGSLFGTFGAIAFIASGRLRQDHHIPFGPFLAIGIWTAVLAGNEIVDAYLTFTGSLLHHP
ncbi:MAG: prepilin peptidase [Chitinispirillaceae bacterium]|nr:prepilin peptidase [Chitinispirillaceae bacterium]